MHPSDAAGSPLYDSRPPPSQGVPMTRMDETNLRILQLLQKNARMSLTDLAQAVGRSESTVRERVTALELGGFLKGYEARVDWDQAGLPALAIMHARCDMNRIAEVAKQL